jgi:hypothetical protein
MCNIQNRTIPVPQLVQFRKLSFPQLESTGVIKFIAMPVLQYKVAAKAIEVTG